MGPTVPSQIVALIDAEVPGAKAQQLAEERGGNLEPFGISGALQGNAVAAILALLDGLREHLLVVEAPDRTRYVAAVEALRQIATNAQSPDRDIRKNPVKLSAGSGLLNPVTVLRQVLSRCPDEPAPHAVTNRGFLSHAASDEPLASHLRVALEAGAPSVKYFQASHRGQIPPGDSWCGPIFDNLRQADRYLILLSPASVGRPWISFETGVAWMPKERPLVVLCVGLEPKDVPTPFAELQLLFLDGPRGREALLGAFERLGSEPPADVETFLGRARVLAASCAIDGMAEQGFDGIRVGDRYLAWAGPVDDLQDQPGVRLSTPDEEEIVAALRAHGLEVSYGNLDRPGSRHSRQVFSISPGRWKRAILYQDGRQVLMVRRAG